MRASLRLLVWRGIAIGAHWSLLLVVWLIAWSLADEALPTGAPGYSTTAYWIAGTATSVAFLVGIAAHELSHAVVAQRHGIAVRSITLWLFGGIAQLERQPSTWRDELGVAVAGPMMSLGLGGLALGAAGVVAVFGDADLTVTSLVWLGSTNLILAVFNLLPGAPLDGGRVYAAWRWRHHGDAQRARADAARAGAVVASVLIGLGMVAVFAGFVGSGLWLGFLGWFLGSAARAELAEQTVRHTFEGVRVRDVMTPDPVTVPPWMTLETLVTDVLGHRVHGSTIPVVDPSPDGHGRLIGLVTPEHLRRIPPREWSHLAVGTVAVPVDQLALAHPDDPLLQAMDQGERDTRRLVVVDVSGQVVGVVTPTDLARTIQLAEWRDLARR